MGRESRWDGVVVLEGVLVLLILVLMMFRGTVGLAGTG